MQRWAAVGLLWTVAVAGLTAQIIPSTGEAMYDAWCAACHGADGRGRASTRPVRTEPLDFTDCRLAAGESDADWTQVIARGGPAAGLSADMPEFSVLTAAQIDALVRRLRRFCASDRWPTGNLGFPRALFTEKALPEDEIVLRPAVSHSPFLNTSTRLDLVYERRIGARTGVEATLPVHTIEGPVGRHTGIGDITLALSHVVAADDRRGILTAGVEASMQTGSHRWDFGEGTFVLEPFLAAGRQAGSWFLQADIRALLPAKRFPTEPVRYVEYNASIGTAFARPVPNWTAGIEINATDRIVAITPQVSKRLTASGALVAGFGARFPITTVYREDPTIWTGFLIWDWREPISRK